MTRTPLAAFFNSPLQDLTDHIRLAFRVDISSLFQAVLARIGTLTVSERPIESIVNEAVQLRAEALRVERCKILIQRNNHELLSLVADFGWRHGLIESFPITGGPNSQVGYAIRKRRHVVVRDLRIETRFTPSKFPSESSRHRRNEYSADSSRRLNRQVPRK